MRHMTTNFGKLQNSVEDRLSKMEIEQVELKNKILNLEKNRIECSSPSALSDYRSPRDSKKYEAARHKDGMMYI